MAKPFVLEICIDSIQSAINAINGGAHRLEVCLSLKDDGVTPSNGLLLAIREFLEKRGLLDRVQLFAMIRRGGDFCYSQEELNQMKLEINALKGLVSGFVFGALKPDGSLDEEACKQLLNECVGYENTFHRAIDRCRDPYELFEQIIELGFGRVITSGQGKNAFEGLEVIKKLIELNRGRIKLSPASGIDDENLEELIQKLGAKTNEFHCSAKVLQRSKMETDPDGTFNYHLSSEQIVSKMIQIGEKHFNNQTN